MNKANELLRRGVARLDFANEELNRPDEDVMAISLCQQARSIMADFLSAYLLANGKDISEVNTLEGLRTMSRELDEKFAALDLENMVCHPGHLQDQSNYCMDVNRVRTCLTMANELKEIVMKSVKVD